MTFFSLVRLWRIWLSA